MNNSSMYKETYNMQHLNNENNYRICTAIQTYTKSLVRKVWHDEDHTVALAQT